MTSARAFGNRAPAFRLPPIGIVVRGMRTACDITARGPEEDRSTLCVVVEELKVEAQEHVCTKRQRLRHARP